MRGASIRERPSSLPTTGMARALACGAMLAGLLLAGAGPFAVPRASAASRAAECRTACAPAVDACVAEGRRRRKCRRTLVRRCRREGLAVCSPPTTTTTTRVAVTLPPTTIGGFPTTSTTSRSLPSTSTTVTSVPVTTSTTTTAPPLGSGTPWVERGPIRWIVPPPEEATSGDTFPVALEVDVGEPWVRVEGSIRRCSLINDSFCDLNWPGPVFVQPATFAGPPGRFDFAGATAWQCGPPTVAEAGFLMATVFLIDGEGHRAGPFSSPLAWTLSHATPRSALSVSTEPLVFTVRPGETPTPRTLPFQATCQTTFPVEAQADVPWLLVSDGDHAFEVGVDVDALDAAGSPYHGAITLTAPESLNARVVVPVTVYVGDVEVSWTDVPASIAADASFAATLRVTGDLASVSGTVRAVADGLQPFRFDPGGQLEAHIEGPPGTFAVDGRRVASCQERVAYLQAEVTAIDASGSPAGTFVAASAPIALPARGGAFVYTDPEASIAFHALAGQDPLREQFPIYVACSTSGLGTLSAETDVAWLTAEVQRPILQLGGPWVEVQAHVAGLAPADGPFHGTVTVRSTVAAAPLRLPVTLDLRDVTATWVTPPPDTLEVDQAFTMALQIDGDVQVVGGEIRNCATGYPPNEVCLSEAPLRLSNGGRFAGPAGTFTFAGRRADYIDFSHENAIVARFFLAGGAPGERIGPFYSPLVPVALPEPPKPWLDAGPAAIAMLGLAGQDPVVARLRLFTYGSGDVAWTATTDASWLRVEPAEGVASFRAPAVYVVADTAGLDPAAGPYQATVRIEAPGSQQGSVEVPVTLTLVR